jgi:hypothetical protein
MLARIIHEHLLHRPILSPGVAFLVRSPRRTANNCGIKKRPAHHLAGAHKRGALLFIAPCALREAHGKGRVLARLGWAGARTGFGLGRFATAFMNIRANEWSEDV